MPYVQLYEDLRGWKNEVSVQEMNLFSVSLKIRRAGLVEQEDPGDSYPMKRFNPKIVRSHDRGKMVQCSPV